MERFLVRKCVKSDREMQCKDPQKQRYCFYFTYTISTVKSSFPSTTGLTWSVCISLRRVRPNFNYLFSCSIVICRSALQNLKRAQISSFCVFLMVSEGSQITNSKFSASVLPNRCEPATGYPWNNLFSRPSVLFEFTLYDITETRILMTAYKLSLASCVLLCSFYNAITTPEDIYHVPDSNFGPAVLI
jgi:hypothetical protein